MSALFRSPRAAVVALLLVCILAFFWRLGGNGIFDLDEALYVESAREMRMTGDYVVPRVNGDPFFEKPPLIYWEAAACFALFGRSELTARLPSALASLGLTLLILWFGTRTFGRRAGFLAGFFFALSPLVLGSGRQLTTDATLDLCIAAALVCFFRARQAEPGPDKRWYYGFWAAAGLGTLAKGLPGILIPTVVAFLWLCFSEPFDLRRVLRGILEARLLGGIALFLLIVLPWHVAAWNAAGDVFTKEYIIRQHLQRFRGGDTSHLAPFWFFIPGFLVGAFPWSLFVPAALLSRCQGDSAEWDNASTARRLLKIWAIIVFLMFSASGSKLISYILPMYPPAALLAGDWCARAITSQRRSRTLIGAGAVGLVLTGALFTAVVFIEPIIHFVESRTGKPMRMDQVPPEMIPWAAHLFGTVAAMMGAYLLLVALGRRKAAVVSLLAGMTIFVGVAVLEGLPILHRTLLAPLQTVATDAGRSAVSHRAPILFVTGSTRRPSVLFYLPDEILGKKPDEGGVVETTDLKKVEDLLTSPTPWLLVIDDDHASKMRAGVPMGEYTHRDGWRLFRTTPRLPVYPGEPR